MKNKHIIIVGAGPGGLCAGMLLSHRGFKVSIYDKNPEVGGRNRAMKEQGFTFDIGPTFLLMKDVLDEMFELCDRNSSDYLQFFPLEAMYQLSFDDRKVSIYSNPEKMREEIKRAFPDSSADYDGFLEKESKRFQRLYPCITRDFSSLKSFFSWNLIKAIPYLAINHSVFSNLGRYFEEEKIRLMFSFQSKYLGMSPWDCPAMFTMLSYLEHRYGIYHVKGGLNKISHAMADVIKENSGVIYNNTTVKSLQTDRHRVTGIRLADDSLIEADEVIVNADFSYSMSNLVKPGLLKKYNQRKLEKKEYSCSTFMLYLGLDKQYDLPHHNIVFAKNYRQNVKNIFQHKILSEEFSFYVQNASVTDDSLAPAGNSTLYVLVPVPNNQSGLDWQEHRDKTRKAVFAALADRLGLSDLTQHIVFERTITPENWQTQENVFFGATFNLSHRFSQMLYWRPHNQFEELDSCYLVGGGTHPGSGLPTIYQSAHISANLICKKYGDDSLNKNNFSWLTE